MNWFFLFFLESVYFKVGFFTFCLLGSFHPVLGKQAPNVVKSQLNLSFLQDHPFVLDLEVFVGKLPYFTRNPT